MNKVLSCVENQAGDHCVDLFMRDDGTFGFEEYRRDAEDAKGWFSLQHYSHLLFGTQEEAHAEARVKVAWMKEA